MTMKRNFKTVTVGPIGELVTLPDFTAILTEKGKAAGIDRIKVTALKKSDFYNEDMYLEYMDKIGNLLTAVTTGKKTANHLKAVLIALGVNESVDASKVNLTGLGVKFKPNTIADTESGKALKECRKAISEKSAELKVEEDAEKRIVLATELFTLKEDRKKLENTAGTFTGKSFTDETINRFAFAVEQAIAAVLAGVDLHDHTDKHDNGDWLKYRNRANELTAQGYPVDGDTFVKADDIKGLKNAVKTAYKEKQKAEKQKAEKEKADKAMADAKEKAESIEK